MNLANWNQHLTLVGTFGWFALLVFHALRRRRLSELFVGLLFSMAIIDGWAVAPAAAAEKGNTPTISLAFWSGAIAPYVIVVWWLLHPVKAGEKESPGS